jgi:pilus assembly protein CpaB
MIKGMALKGGNRFSLILGIGLGIVAAVLIAVYLTGAKSDGGGSTVSGPSVPVVTAAVDIPQGTKIDASMVSVKDFPEGSVLVGAFSTPEEVVGQVTTIRVVAGEQVIADKVTATGANITTTDGNPPLALLVTEGMRGTSVEINTIVGAGGNLRPGDYVDVILSIAFESENAISGGKNQASAVILQNLQVAAVDTSIANSTGENPDDQEDSDNKATTVTLLATPTASEVLALADTCRMNFEGRIALAVRSFGDDAAVGNRGVWANDGPTPDCFTLMGIEGLR